MNAEALVGPAFAVSHHTGNLTQFAIAIKNGKWTLALIYLGLIVVFFLGSTIAGMLFYQCDVGRSKRYGYFSSFRSRIRAHVVHHTGHAALDPMLMPHCRLAYKRYLDELPRGDDAHNTHDRLSHRCGR